ncbi:hypothetical protein AVEN_142408-1 [Araneus ventricosus]|uniref:Uncharacterized protein n=1 Tax=Araneus ventricosus TaxID=182803 RepID=A0A4Y2JWG4_ARAVE|nr:hypothetical protein AVEN_142408-1 [Araneus ventricosus]
MSLGQCLWSEKCVLGNVCGVRNASWSWAICGGVRNASWAMCGGVRNASWSMCGGVRNVSWAMIGGMKMCSWAMCDGELNEKYVMVGSSMWRRVK